MREQASPTLQSLATIVSGDLQDAVATTTVDSWRETLAMILTYAREEEFITLCQQLSSRLEQLGAREDALLCSICAVDVSSLLRLGMEICPDYRVRSHLSVMEALLILCTMVPAQDLHLDSQLSAFGEKLAVLCEALEEQGMVSVTSHFLQSLRTAPSAQSLLQAMAAAVPELLPGFKPVQQSVQPTPAVSKPFSQPAPQPFSQPTPQPFSQPAPQPFSQPAPQPFSQPAPQPFSQPAPQPFSQPTPQPFSPQTNTSSAPKPFIPQPQVVPHMTAKPFAPSMPMQSVPQPLAPTPAQPQPQPAPEPEVEHPYSL